MTLNVTIDLPESVQQQIEQNALSEHRSIADVIRDLVIQNWRATPRLPDDVEVELNALPDLSDEALWLLARSTLSDDEQSDLAELNHKGKIQQLTHAEEERLIYLLELYDRTLIRRAQAATILQHRGYQLHNPVVLRE